jgi:hypothetical protein
MEQGVIFIGLFGFLFVAIQYAIIAIAYIFVILFRAVVAVVVGIAYLCGLYADHRRAKKGLPRRHGKGRLKRRHSPQAITGTWPPGVVDMPRLAVPPNVLLGDD